MIELTLQQIVAISIVGMLFVGTAIGLLSKGGR